MRQPWLAFALLAAFTLAAGSSALAAAGVGSKAPRLESSKWLNSKVPISWDSFKGRLILVERWATW